MTTEEHIRELGLELPSAPAPAGNYVPAVRTGNLLYLSGTICLRDGAMSHTGKLGDTRDIDYGRDAARVCLLNLLATAKAELGELDRITRIVQINGFVNAVPGFPDSPAVINGASDLIAEIFRERGAHTRAAVAVTGLPKDSTVELQAVFEIGGVE